MMKNRKSQASQRTQPFPNNTNHNTTPSSIDDGVSVSLATLIKLKAFANQLKFDGSRTVRHTDPGQQASRQKGQGIDFSEVRIYQPGDEIRNMDWRVTARTGKPHTKLYHQERERAVFLVVDYRDAMFFGTRKAFKSVVAAKAAATIAWTMAKQGNRIGGYVFTDTHFAERMPKLRQQGVLPLLKTLASIQKPQDLSLLPHVFPHATAPTAQPIFMHVLDKLRQTAKSGSLIVILSDFAGITDDFEQTLIALNHRHDIRLGFIYDELEHEPPPSNYYPISDGKNIATIDTHQQQFCDDYRSRFIQKYQIIMAASQKFHIPLMEFATHQSITKTLQSGLK